MWLRTDDNLINLDNVKKFDRRKESDRTEFVYADFAGAEERVCACFPAEVQPLLDAITNALANNRKVFSVSEWLDNRLIEEANPWLHA